MCFFTTILFKFVQFDGRVVQSFVVQLQALWIIEYHLTFMFYSFKEKDGKEGNNNNVVQVCSICLENCSKLCGSTISTAGNRIPPHIQVLYSSRKKMIRREAIIM
jgi:hypothetical protein